MLGHDSAGTDVVTLLDEVAQLSVQFQPSDVQLPLSASGSCLRFLEPRFPPKHSFEKRE